MTIAMASVGFLSDVGMKSAQRHVFLRMCGNCLKHVVVIILRLRSLSA